jgi:hypothetical protein
MKKSLLITVSLFAFTIAKSQVTWSGEIASMVYTNCSNCHNVHGIAPFELMSYSDAVQNGLDIKDDVNSRKMPPWPPSPSYSHFAHERILTQQQIDDITSWVDNGMPRGDSTQEPSAPVINTNAEITSPDRVLQAPVFNVNTAGGDLYQCFVIPAGNTVDEYITDIEAIPGNRGVVHHILIYADTSNYPAYWDNLSPGPGYPNFGGTGSPYSKLIGVWVPGMGAYHSPQGMGIRLPANANVILQIHYPGGITGAIDSTKLLLKVSPVWHREIAIESPLNHYQLDNGPLVIPANTTRTFYAHYTVPADISTLGVGPHMHLIGTNIRSWGVTPSNDTIPFIDIPRWDFHWQGIYSFPRVLKIPTNTVIYSEAHYDNTTNNPENPNNPPVTVTLGESTTDEMMLVYFAYTVYFPGDEFIVIDSAVATAGVEQIHNSAINTPQLYDPSPNPSHGKILYQYYLPEKTATVITLTDVNGRIIKQENNSPSSSGLFTSEINIEDVSAGTYFLTLNSSGVIRSKKLLIQ